MLMHANPQRYILRGQTRECTGDVTVHFVAAVVVSGAPDCDAKRESEKPTV